MPSPFPGMDPYLEHPELWPDVHHGLIEALRESLAPRLRPRYRVSIEKRSYIEEPEGLVFLGRPDVSVVRGEPSGAPDHGPAAGAGVSGRPVSVTVPMPDSVHEAYLEIRDTASGEVVTALELLSPTNKRSGEGRRAYESKRLRILGSSTHLVEVDILRAGQPMPVSGRAPGAYAILVSRSEDRPRALLYPFGLRERIPAFSLPLRAGDEEPEVDLQAALHDLYDRAGYDLAVDYRVPPEPPLAPDDAAWADALLRGKGLR